MLFGAVLVGIGLVLALVFPELRFLWFEGRPLGIVLAVVGAFDLVGGYRRERGVSGG